MKIIDIPQSGKEGLTVSFPLSHSQAVHHADGNPANNDLDNLLLLTAREHNSLHTPPLPPPRPPPLPHLSQPLRGLGQPYPSPSLPPSR
jgi:hypothetical protein